MATNTVPTPDAQALQLQCLQALCMQIAQSVYTARMALDNHAHVPDVAHLVGESLERVGWMVERAARVAGYEGAPIAGDADGWMLRDDVRALLVDLQAAEAAEALPEVAHG